MTRNAIRARALRVGGPGVETPFSLKVKPPSVVSLEDIKANLRRDTLKRESKASSSSGGPLMHERENRFELSLRVMDFLGWVWGGVLDCR
jgi:hypothetical protein